METKTINVNEAFEITLKGKGTAGYGWQWKDDAEGIVSVELYKQPSTVGVPPIPGSSTDEVFTITALKKGTVTIHFYLVRSWEPASVKPKDEMDLEISVE